MDERERSPPSPASAVVVDCAALVHPTVLIHLAAIGDLAGFMSGTAGCLCSHPRTSEQTRFE
ncbi:hypothetical protein THIOKS11180020 [Thiocapsa sp. KS1]|nr:hypothetical protein THIOKS11180020 [Thiocapsa sp. KS1]